MRHTNYVSSFLENSYMNLFLYKETHFFAFIQFSSLFAQLCYLVAHPVGTHAPRLSAPDLDLNPYECGRLPDGHRSARRVRLPAGAGGIGASEPLCGAAR